MSRIYGLKCPVAKTLDLVGERWTLLIVRDLLFDGRRRFAVRGFLQQFKDAVDKVSLLVF